MGEPLANYKRVVNAVRRITSPAPDGLGISQRSVVVSTVGLAPAIRKLADTGRRVSIEYALIRDINDQPWRADMLGSKLRKTLGSRVHVNLIPLNPTPGSKWDASPKPVEREFVRRVEAQGVPCTVRDTRGQEIAAAGRWLRGRSPSSLAVGSSGVWRFCVLSVGSCPVMVTYHESALGLRPSRCRNPKTT
ncbi:hypothetical protein NONO_c55790 [Nocardia nova SH22a]|uniref:Uncharacterized protein n=1 Tax=Nocardia nova SH22a TaxID=1415166 RepID=W5TMN3_9NOCA|nr:hypothetical protein NONO_c55790 [Nocardia nova SH22a]